MSQVNEPRRGFRQRWAKIRRIWALTGLTAGVIFIGWSLLAYRANADARHALTSGNGVNVSHADGYWQFQPSGTPSRTGLIFLPGALVDPIAYAPVTAAVARGGHTAVLIEVPRRGAFGGAESPEVSRRVRAAMNGLPDVRGWVVAGHSLGGRIAADLMRTPDPKFPGLVLIGTSHPREFSLAHLEIPVVQVFGTRDTVADADKVQSALVNLPPATRSVRIDGGNHSQFGYYGFQPGDWPATISRETQQQLTVQAILEALKTGSGRGFRTRVQDDGSRRGFKTRGFKTRVQDDGSKTRVQTTVQTTVVANPRVNRRYEPSCEPTCEPPCEPPS